MTDSLDCVVVGAGVVGLAIARRYAMAGREVVVLEQESEVATHTSSRNSEVIHAGIYYPTNSLKADLCVRGKDLLYQYCASRDVPFRKTGKLIVAVEQAERAILDRYQAQAAANGVTDLIRMDRKQVSAMEPALECVTGLFSPSTGILDSHSFITSLIADIQARKGEIVCRSHVSNISREQKGLRITIGSDTPYSVQCRTLINSAGLWAQDLANNTTGCDIATIPSLYLAKAHYYSFQGKSPFQNLIYPVASGGGLGVHVTLDMGGQARFGPDVSWVNNVDYSFDDSRRASFVTAIKKYYPALDENRLQPGYTGIRPKLSGPNDPSADFAIHFSSEHGVEGLVNLFGIESPGLTAALAIADYVYEMEGGLQRGLLS